MRLTALTGCGKATQAHIAFTGHPAKALVVSFSVNHIILRKKNSEEAPSLHGLNSPGDLTRAPVEVPLPSNLAEPIHRRPAYGGRH